MELMDFLNTESIILVVALVFLGKIIKDTNFIKDKYIPLVLLGVSILISFLIFSISVDSFIQGVISTSVAVYGNQVVKQLEKEE